VKGLIALAAAAASAVLVPAAVLVPVAARASAAPVHRCFEVVKPYQSYPAAGGCHPGDIQVALRAGTAQVLTATNRKQSSTHARFNGFSLVNGTWQHTWGPWTTARIGAGGFADPGQKIEGDALTPQGSYGFGFMFGVNANPGVRFSWRHAYRTDYWDDDPASPRYNLWTDITRHGAGAAPEPMHNVPVYNYAAVIAYNTARVPGAGSAIFLHVGDGQATAGCVSLPQSALLKVIRWLAPASNPVITMGVL
jgi:L,D-peptidoglycan transpeptidase YkuD (ErfK/YbiS/YcfS/YnhG family)